MKNGRPLATGRFTTVDEFEVSVIRQRTMGRSWAAIGLREGVSPRTAQTAYERRAKSAWVSSEDTAA